MKTVPFAKLTKEIHFPIIQAIYAPPVKTNFFKRIVSFTTYRRKFKVREDYILWVPLLKKYIFIPCYFVFDGASVPKILNGIYSPTGILLLGSLIHDFGYRYKGLFVIDQITLELEFLPLTKKELDKIFNSLSAYESGMKKASGIATASLSLFGFLGWNTNRKANLDLEHDFPELFVSNEASLD